MSKRTDNTFKPYDPKEYKEGPSVDYTIYTLQKEIKHLESLAADPGSAEHKHLYENYILQLKNNINFLKEYRWGN